MIMIIDRGPLHIPVLPWLPLLWRTLPSEVLSSHGSSLASFKTLLGLRENVIARVACIRRIQAGSTLLDRGTSYRRIQLHPWPQQNVNLIQIVFRRLEISWFVTLKITDTNREICYRLSVSGTTSRIP